MGLKSIVNNIEVSWDRFCNDCRDFPLKVAECAKSDRLLAAIIGIALMIFGVAVLAGAGSGIFFLIAREGCNFFTLCASAFTGVSCVMLGFAAVGYGVGLFNAAIRYHKPSFPSNTFNL